VLRPQRRGSAHLGPLVLPDRESYSKVRGTPTPMDIEWGREVRPASCLFILQASPEAVQSRKRASVLRCWHLEPHQSPAHRSSGPAREIHDPSQIDRFRDGDLLVTVRTDPDWEPILRKAAGVITDQGGQTCHGGGHCSGNGAAGDRGLWRRDRGHPQRH